MVIQAGFVNGVPAGAREPAPSIQIEVRVPEGSSVVLAAASGDIVVTGALRSLNAVTKNGSITADSVEDLTINTADGSVEIHRLANRGDITTRDGAVEIHRYEGSELTVETRFGDLSLRAASAASGTASLTSVDGDITVRDAAHLDVVPSTDRGRIVQR